MSEQLVNNASTTLNGALDNSQTNVVVTSATPFPVVGEFRLLVKAEGSNTDEIMTVTAVSGTTFTVTRASEATAGVQAASAHASGATVSHVLTAGALKTLAISTGTIGCRAIWASGSIPGGGGYQPVPLNGTEAFDTNGFHSTSSNTSRMTIPPGLGGTYLVTGVFYNNTNELNYGIILKNGSQANSDYGTTGDDAILTVTTVLQLNGGDYVELGINATTLNTIAASSLTVIKLDAGRVGKGVGASAKASGNTSTSTTFTAVAYGDTDIFDSDGFHDPSTNNTRLTIPTGLGGRYLLLCDGTTTTSASLIGEFLLNGSTPLGYFTGAPNASHYNGSFVADLVAGDYVEVLVKNSTGSDVSTADSHFQIMRLDSNGTGVLASDKVELTAADFTTTSTTFVDVTGLSITLTTGARRVLLNFVGVMSSGSGYVMFDYAVDGVRVGAAASLGHQIRAGASEYQSVGGSYLTDVLSAGSHTFNIKMRGTDGSTARIYGNNPTSAFSAIEMPDSGALATSTGASVSQIVRGYVDSAGTKVSGTGFTSSKTATGHYVLTFSPAFTQAPIVVATSAPTTPGVNNGIWAQIDGDAVTTTNVDLWTIQGTTGNAMDSGFTFIAMSIT